MLSWWVDGERAAAVPADDRGLAYGDGLFETLRLAGGRPRFLERHLARLAAGCGRLGIPCPPSRLLEEELLRAAAAAPADGVLKLIVTRGSGGRGYRPPLQAHVRRIVSAHPAPPPPPADGVAVRLCQTRLARGGALAGLKHLNRLEQVLARAEWQDEAVFEGIMLDEAGQVTCGTQSNLFIVRGGAVSTPALTHAGVAGVMRGFVLDTLAHSGRPATVGAVLPAELDAAEELFITSAVIGVVAVRNCAGRPLAAGPVTRALQAALEVAA